MTVTEEPQSNPGYKSVGTRPIRPDGLEKVTGKARFGADLVLPGMLEGAVLRSPHAHARIVSIDTAAAKAMPGVHAVVTGSDFPDLAANGARPDDVLMSKNVIARDKVLYEGHPIAAVAANTRKQAREAAKAIEVTYERLPHVLTVDEAMADGAPILHEGMRTKGVDPTPETDSNVASRVNHERGDLDEGFANADLVIETDLHHQTGPSGLHRAPCRGGRCQPGGPGPPVVLLAGPFRHADSDGDRAGLGADSDQGHSG